MDLDRSFSSANLGGDLFVEQTGNDKRQQFSLTRGQRFKAFPQGGNLRFLLASGAVPPGSPKWYAQQHLLPADVDLASRTDRRLESSRRTSP